MATKPITPSDRLEKDLKIEDVAKKIDKQSGSSNVRALKKDLKVARDSLDTARGHDVFSNIAKNYMDRVLMDPAVNDDEKKNFLIALADKVEIIRVGKFIRPLDLNTKTLDEVKIFAVDILGRQYFHDISTATIPATTPATTPAAAPATTPAAAPAAAPATTPATTPAAAPATTPAAAPAAAPATTPAAAPATAAVVAGVVPPVVYNIASTRKEYAQAVEDFDDETDRAEKRKEHSTAVRLKIANDAKGTYGGLDMTDKANVRTVANFALGEVLKDMQEITKQRLEIRDGEKNIIAKGWNSIENSIENNRLKTAIALGIGALVMPQFGAALLVGNVMLNTLGLKGHMERMFKGAGTANTNKAKFWRSGSKQRIINNPERKLARLNEFTIRRLENPATGTPNPIDAAQDKALVDKYNGQLQTNITKRVTDSLNDTTPGSDSIGNTAATPANLRIMKILEIVDKEQEKMLDAMEKERKILNLKRAAEWATAIMGAVALSFLGRFIGGQIISGVQYAGNEIGEFFHGMWPGNWEIFGGGIDGGGIDGGGIDGGGWPDPSGDGLSNPSNGEGWPDPSRDGGGATGGNEAGGAGNSGSADSGSGGSGSTSGGADSGSGSAGGSEGAGGLENVVLGTPEFSGNYMDSFEQVFDPERSLIDIHNTTNGLTAVNTNVEINPGMEVVVNTLDPGAAGDLMLRDATGNVIGDFNHGETLKLEGTSEVFNVTDNGITRPVTGFAVQAPDGSVQGYVSGVFLAKAA